MNTSALEYFIALVRSCRYYENQYWHNGRSQDNMRQAIALERRINDYVASCRKKLSTMPAYKPEPAAKAFFDLIENWRLRTREYYHMRKESKSDPRLLKEILKHCRQMEQQIDTFISEYDKQLRNNAKG